MSAGVRVENLRAVIRSLERFGVEAADLKAAFNRIGSMVARSIISYTPTLTGALAASVRASKTKNKAVVRAGSARVVYAGVQNFGGYHNITGHHFMEKGVQEKQHDAVDMMNDELNALIRRLDLN